MMKGFPNFLRPRSRRPVFALLALGFLSFWFFVNTVREYPLMTAALEEAHAPSTSGERNGTKILLVSALFPLAKAKHSHEEYGSWLAEFLMPITTDVYFFTYPEFAPTVRKARGDKYPITIDTTYNSPFDIPPMEGLKEKYEEMHNIDREKSYHSPGLYAVWSAKPFFLDAGVKNSAKRGKSYDYAFWNDAGSFRGRHKYTDWPDPKRVEQVWRKGEEITRRRKEDLLFFALTGMYDEDVRKWEEDSGPIDHNISEGSFFGGSPSTVSWWSQTFYAYRDHYMSLGYFVGKDQTVFNAILLLYSERVIGMYYYDGSAPARDGRGKIPLKFCEVDYLGACGSQWYYYQFWLAGQETREAMREMWLEESKEQWKGWQLCRERERCRMTRLLSLKDTLKERFGQGWTPPLRTLRIPGEPHKP